MRRVLIADAEVVVRQELSRTLLAHDLVSDCAASVGEARACLDQRKYGVVLLDVGLPGGDVRDVVSRIASVARAERPVVLAVATSADQARGLDVEIVQIVLRRSGGSDQIIDLIRNCIRSAELRTSSRAASAGAADAGLTPGGVPQP